MYFNYGGASKTYSSYVTKSYSEASVKALADNVRWSNTDINYQQYQQAIIMRHNTVIYKNVIQHGRVEGIGKNAGGLVRIYASIQYSKCRIYSK